MAAVGALPAGGVTLLCSSPHATRHCTFCSQQLVQKLRTAPCCPRLGRAQSSMECGPRPAAAQDTDRTWGGHGAEWTGCGAGAAQSGQAAGRARRRSCTPSPCPAARPDQHCPTCRSLCEGGPGRPLVTDRDGAGHQWTGRLSRSLRDLGPVMT